MAFRYEPGADYEVAVDDVDYLRHGETPYLARIYQPRGTGPFPALLEVHGGAWSGNDRTSSASSALALARSGIVVASIDFRLAPQHPYPAQIQDINYGVRWLKANAAAFRADAATVGGYGSSSGGHTIVLAAMRPRDPRYAALPLPGGEAADGSLRYAIAHSGILDPLARYRYAQAAGNERLVRSTEGFFLTEDAMREANPQLILERGEPAELPPLLVVQGDQDANIPWQIAQKLAQTWQARGGDAEWRLYPGEAHTFANSASPAAEAAIAAMKAFIARCLSAVVPA